MTDPLGVFLLLALGAFGVTLGVIGLRRGKVVAVFDCRRNERPAIFWYGILFQLALGGVCLVMSVVKVLE